MADDLIWFWQGTDGGGGGGQDGASAYEVAVENGFVGSQTEWLASLHGSDGADGQPGDDGADGQSVTVLTFAASDEAGYNAAVAANAGNPLVLVVRYAT